MKKSNRIVAALLALALSAGLCAGCSDAPADDTTPSQDTPSVSQPDDSVADDQTAASQLEGVYNKVLETGVFPEMFILGEAYIESYYGITADSISDSIFSVAMDSLLADTVIIVKVSENGDAAAIESTFKSINDQKKLELESYNPEQYARVNEAVIKTVGDYVYYIVTSDNAAVSQIIENNIG